MAFGDSSLLQSSIHSPVLEFHSYPNPVKGFYPIERAPHTIKSMHILDLMGISTKVYAENGAIDMRNVEVGIYLLAIELKNG